MLLSKCKKTEIVPTFVESAEYLSLVWACQFVSMSTEAENRNLVKCRDC